MQLKCKKLISVLIIVTMFFASGCSIVEPEEALEQTVTSEELASLEELEKVCSELEDEEKPLLYADPSEELDMISLYPTGRACEESFVGFGINLLNGPNYNDGLKHRLLKKEVYGTEKSSSQYISSDPFDTYKAAISVSNSLDEVYTKLSVSAELRTGKAVPFFSGGVSAQFEKSTTVQSTTRFYNSVESYLFSKQMLDIGYCTAEYLLDSGLIEQSALKLINNDSIAPNDLMCKIGTHMIVAAGTGGSVNVSATYNSNQFVTDVDIKAAFDFSTAYVSGKGAAEFLTKNKNIHDNTKLNITAQGGNISAIVNSTNIDIVGKSILNWKESLGTKRVLAYVYDAIPIWKFASKDSRKNSIEAAFDKMTSDGIKELNPQNYFNTKSALIDGAVYTFRSYTTKKSIHVSGSSENGIHLWNYIKQKYPAQEWVAEAVVEKPGFFYFRNKEKGTYLNVCYASKDEGTQLIHYKFNEGKEEMFKPEKLSDKTFYLFTALDGSKIMAVKKCTEENGTKIIISHKGVDDRSQKWYIEEVPYK